MMTIKIPVSDSQIFMPAEKADWRGSGFSTNKKTNNGHQIYQVRLLDWHQGPIFAREAEILILAKSDPVSQTSRQIYLIISYGV